MSKNFLSDSASKVQDNNIGNDILKLIGKTSLVRLNKIPTQYGLECEIYVKCEFLNPGGSMEDRMAKHFMEKVEGNGQLKKGMTLIRKMEEWEEGIGLGMIATLKGYSLVNIQTKSNEGNGNGNGNIASTLKSLGAKMIFAKNDLKAKEIRGKICEEIGSNNALWIENGQKDLEDAYFKSVNEILNEILGALGGRMDMLVIGVECGEQIREKLPAKCELVNVPLANISRAEGIKMAREMQQNEGILCGPNSGQILLATLQAAKKLGAGKKCVAILPDGIRHLLPKFEADSKIEMSNLCSKNDPSFQIEAEYCPTKQPSLNFQLAPEPWKEIAKNCQRTFLPLENVSQTIGETPMVRLNKLPKMHEIEAEIVVKLEFMNPGGSVKDRAAKKMIEMAELGGELRPGMTIIEPSSGNTGIAMAMMAAIKGYKCIIVMPEKMSKEKEITIRSLGAQLVRVPAHPPNVPYTISTDHNPKSDIFLAQRLQRQIPGSIVLDQYRNQWNPFAHYESTAREIVETCAGKLDAIVIGCGTGGTMSGIGRKIKECVPGCKIIGVDPFGSTISVGGGPENAHSYEVEGIGYDFIPAVLDVNLVDEWIKTDDAHSFWTAHQLMREEGLLCGGSSGANVWAAMEVARGMGPGKRVVTILPDGIRNYLSKFVDENWMTEKGLNIGERE